MSHCLNRRTFCFALAAAITTSPACRRGAPPEPRDGLAQLLGLEGDELAWLDALPAEQQAELYTALTSGEPPSRRTVDLIMRVLGRRERLFAYVGYPPLPNQLEACNGLLRE